MLLNSASRFDEASRELKPLANQGYQESAVKVALGISSLLAPYLPADLPTSKRELAATAGQAAYSAAVRPKHDAIREYKQLIERFPSSANVHYAYGVFLRSEAPDEAITEFRPKLEISPSHVPARLQLASEYLRLSDFDAAVTVAREAVEPRTGMVYSAPDARPCFAREE
jgi:tetratricopeptide (TPR) repeat protein